MMNIFKSTRSECNNDGTKWTCTDGCANHNIPGFWLHSVDMATINAPMYCEALGAFAFPSYYEPWGVYTCWVHGGKWIFAACVSLATLNWYPSLDGYPFCDNQSLWLQLLQARFDWMSSRWRMLHCWSMDAICWRFCESAHRIYVCILQKDQMTTYQPEKLCWVIESTCWLEKLEYWIFEVETVGTSACLPRCILWCQQWVRWRWRVRFWWWNWADDPNINASKSKVEGTAMPGNLGTLIKDVGTAGLFLQPNQQGSDVLED